MAPWRHPRRDDDHDPLWWGHVALVVLASLLGMAWVGLAAWLASERVR